jgi:hypothetical protein
VNPVRAARLGVTVAFAVTLTALLPQAFAGGHHASVAATSHSEPEEQIPGLTRASLVAQAQHLFAHPVVSTDLFDTSSTSQRKSKSTYIDNTQDKSPTTNGEVTITYNPDGTVWMVACDATTPRPDTSVALRFCTNLGYSGANPPAIRSWVHTTFAKPVNGLSLQQQRSRATWSLEINNYGDGLTFGINIQPSF